jgi:L-asparaginase/Glu-tRNA(Gln) amidotransferase subunit D
MSAMVEVCIFFNRKLMRGCRTRKVSSFEVDAFDSPLMKPLLIGKLSKVDR